MIAFYYGLTGFACFWFYRNDPLTFRQSMSRRVIPLLGGIMLLVLFVYAASQYIDPDYGYTSVTLPARATPSAASSPSASGCSCWVSS